MREVIVGLDLGHSAVKITFDRDAGVARARLPSPACPAIQRRHEAQAQRARQETVPVKGRAFIVGETAAIQGKSTLANGLTSAWTASEEHGAGRAFVRQIVDEQAAAGPRRFVLRLPVTPFETDRERLKKVARDSLGTGVVQSLPQPLGGDHGYMRSLTGMPLTTRSVTEESWGVINVGYDSTDFVLMSGGRWIEAASGSCGGVRLAVEHLQRMLVDDHQIERDLVNVEQALRVGHLKNFGQRLELTREIQLATDVVAVTVTVTVTDMAGRLMASYASSLDGVLVTGGGAGLVLPVLQQRWPQARIIADAHAVPALQGPRFVVSEGSDRFGRHWAWLASMQRKRAAS